MHLLAARLDREASARGNRCARARARAKMDLSAARINHSMLSSFVDQRVTIVGKVLSTSAHVVELEASDGGKISVIPSPGSDYSR